MFFMSLYHRIHACLSVEQDVERLGDHNRIGVIIRKTHAGLDTRKRISYRALEHDID